MDDFNSLVQNQLNALMPWIGLYIAAASGVCVLAMAADAFNGFRSKKLWFPCKYFSLNAVSLTLLAVAMKLPMDLNTILLHSPDWYAKLCSLVFMSTAMANFVSSLGSMGDKEALANVVALGILVITIVANVLSQAIQLEFLGPIRISILSSFLLPSISMLLLLVKFLSSAVTIPTVKRSLESMYQERHKETLREEEEVQRMEAFRVDNQIQEMMKYWVMAETGNPQFVIARSIVCTTTTLFFLLPAIALPMSHIHTVRVKDVLLARPTSVYGGYTRWILVIQSVGVVVGLIAPVFRWFVVVGFKCFDANSDSVHKDFRVESHWIQALIDLRDNFSATQIRKYNKCTKYLHDAKWISLTMFIGFQSSVILACKFIVFVSAFLIRSLVLYSTHVKNFVARRLSDNHHVGKDQSDDTYLSLSRYVVLLEGESQLPKRIFNDICFRADNMIQTGRKSQAECLLTLLHKFVDFHGIREFDSKQIPSLHSQEPPNCWTLPVVTLTSIAIALPNVPKDKRKQLVKSVSEGISLAKIVDKTFSKNDELLHIRKAANVSWVEVVLYNKWQDMDIRKTSLKCKSSDEVLKKMSSKAERTIMKFKRHATGPVMENPLNWPVKVVAANSMYRISRTMLLYHEAGTGVITDEGFFEGLCVMIAEILAACLTNLTRVITTMCHHNAIEKREKSVRKAFFLLGKTERILEFLQHPKWTSPDDRDREAYIEEWRALLCEVSGNPSVIPTPTSSNEIVDHASSYCSEEHIAVTVDCCL